MVDVDAIDFGELLDMKSELGLVRKRRDMWRKRYEDCVPQLAISTQYEAMRRNFQAYWAQRNVDVRRHLCGFTCGSSDEHAECPRRWTIYGHITEASALIRKQAARIAELEAALSEAKR